MTDFTREELELILHNLTAEKDKSLNHKIYCLYQKIRGMLETCDHFSKYRDHEGDLYCRKCGRLVDDEK